MRNPDRLDDFYKELGRIHKEYFPDWRYGQFIVNFLRWYGRDPFFLEEDAMLKKIYEFVEDDID